MSLILEGAQLAFAVFGAAFGAYMAVKVRLAVLDNRVGTVERRADHAHERIDDLYQRGASIR